MDNNDMTGEVLVLSDGTGNYYALPREVLEQHKVTGDQQAEVEKALGDDVSGYTMYNNYMTEMRAGTHQANLRHEADQQRLASSAGSEESRGEGKPATHRSMFTGVFANLRFLKPNVSKQP